MTVSVEQRIAAARLRKAHKLVAALREVETTTGVIDTLGDKFPWDAAAAAAGVRMPSDETKALVYETLEFLEAQDRAHVADPFAGLV